MFSLASSVFVLSYLYMTLTISFQNVRSLNIEKINRLYKYLNKGSDIIFLSEVDNENQNFYQSNLFQFHYDPLNFRRIGVIAANNVNIVPFEPGLKLTQLRNQNDQNAVYSYVYKLELPSNRTTKTLFIENFCIPNLSPRNTDRLIEYLNSQTRKFSGNYICGGDFNKNWLDKNCRESFSDCPGLIQHIHTPTRIAKVNKKDASGKTIAKVTKSIIDLIFTSTELNNTVTNKYVKIIPKNKRDKSAAFDHKSVNVSLAIKNPHYFREIKYYSNPMNRSLPKKQDIPNLLSEVNEINMDQVESYDHLTNKLEIILNKFCPKNTPVEKTKKLFRTPLSKKILAAIRNKHYLHVLSKKDPIALPAYKKQRNVVTKMIRENKMAYQNSFIKNTKNVKDLTKAVKILQSDKITNMNGNPEIVKIDNKYGVELAQAILLGVFYKSRAEDLVTKDQIVDFGPPGPVLRPGETMPNTFQFNFPIFDNLYDYVPKKKISNEAGPDSVSSAILEIIWPSYKNKLNHIVQRHQLQYPIFNQGYFQRTIPKVDTPKILKDLRPLGVLNVVPKYCFNKPFFKKLREHITPILIKRNNYSYRGTHLCIIRTFDKIIEKLNNFELVMLVKYDYSNAYGCTVPELVIDALKQLNLSSESLEYLRGYIYI